MRFDFIREHQETFEVGAMCGMLKVSRSGFYSWSSRPESPRSRETRRLTGLIRTIHQESRATYGSPRVHAELLSRGVPCGENRVARIMRDNEIRSKRKRRFRKTTDSKHKLPVAPNLLEQNFNASRPNEVWLADITYIPTAQGWLYLATVEDLYSRLEVGYAMSNSLETPLVIDALQMALNRRHPPAGLIHHSDRGSQYASKDYQKLLDKYGIRPSMSGKGNCYDNAPMESFFATLKTEMVHHERFSTRAEARAKIFEFIEVFYNRSRRHSSLGYLSPAEYETAAEGAGA
jgi:transposase InsO family protein